MALLEISELMYDPDFADQFTYTRNTVTVNNYGEAVTTSVALTAYGSIQPASARIYQIFPDLVRVAGSIEIYTTTALTVASEDGYASDTLVWNGQNFTVMGITDDFSNYGPGYYVALASITDLLSTSPNNLNSSNPT